MIETVDQVKQIISQPGFDPYSEAGQAALSGVKRPSPAFEYIMQLQSLQAQQTPGNAAGWHTQVNNPMNSAALQTAAQNYGQLNQQSDQFEAGEKNSELGMQLAFLAAVAGGAAGGYFGGAGGGAGYAAGAGGEGALSAAEFAANAGVGQATSQPWWMQPMAGGVSDTGFGAGTVPSTGYSGMEGMATADLADANMGQQMLSATGQSYPEYLNSIGSSGTLSSLGNTLSSLGNNKLLGTAIGALAGSANGQKQAGTTSTTTDIPEYLKPYYLDLISKGQAQTNQAPADYSQSDSLLKSIMAGTANPYVNQNNPYFENTLNLALNDTQGRVNNQFRNNAFGGSANQEMLTRNLGDQSNSMRFGQYKNAQDLYGQELGRATSVATGMPQYNAQKTTANFQPLLNQKSLLSNGGSQTSSPYYTNPAGGALYGGLLGSQLFGGK